MASIKRIRFYQILLLSAAAVTAVFVPPPSALASRQSGQWGEIRDIHFGEVLYQFYQQNYFSAITHLSAAQKVNKLRHDADHGELLLGGMYLSYGMHQAAGDIFSRIIKAGATPEVQDRAWFYIGKIRYQRSYLEQAEEALTRIGNDLPRELQEERQVMLANLLMKKGRYDAAVEALEPLRGYTPWTDYGRYNLGVALVKSGHHRKGFSLLEKVGGLDARAGELKALRDQANLALGYAHLQTQQAARARKYLQKVRLDGMLSNKALLGAGWAYSSLGDYQKALVHWSELRKRNVIDSAVQESLLAMPYALGQLQAYKQAAEHYQQAIVIFETEIERLGYSIKAINAGKLTEQLSTLDPSSEMGWFWTLRNLPDTPESRYLYRLLASHDFQEALKTYRDLRFIDNNIRHWMANMDVFDDILLTRRRAYQERLPRIYESQRALDIGALEKRRNALAERIFAIEQAEDALALSSADEQSRLSKLSKIERTLDRLAKRTDVFESRKKHAMLRGVLQWRILTEYKPRLWQAKKGLKELDAALRQAKQGRAALYRAQERAPRTFEGFGARINAARKQLPRLLARVQSLENAMAGHLQGLAVTVLAQQRERLGSYLTQARFAVAQIFDKALQQASDTP